MLLELSGTVDPVVPDEPVVPLPVVEGMVDEVEPGVVVVSVVLLLQPPSERAAARTSATAPADLSVDAYISVSFSKLERLNVSQL